MKYCHIVLFIVHSLGLKLSAEQVLYTCFNNDEMICFLAYSSPADANFMYDNSQGESFSLSGDQFKVTKTSSNFQVTGTIPNHLRFSYLFAELPIVGSDKTTVTARIKLMDPVGLPKAGHFFECAVEKIN
jgi:hypothetical protein